MLKNITNTLQNNPAIIIVMFIFSILSAVITVILGWNQFYNDYLSKTINTPVWLVILLFLLTCALFSFRREPIKAPEIKELKNIEGKDFGVQRIPLDGHHFKRCTFTGSELIFSGRQPFSLSSNSLTDIKFTFSDEASNTITSLTKMYKDQAFRPLIDQTLENIKSGTTPAPPPITSI